MGKELFKLIANNKKAYHDYFVEETFEAGLELVGTEVKSLRMGKCSIKESFIRIRNGEALVYGMNISPYEKGNIFNRDPLRVRRLLLHKSEIRKMNQKAMEQGMTLVPLQVYFKGSLCKMELGLCRGKSSMTSGRTLRKRTRKEKRSGITKYVISAHNLFRGCTGFDGVLEAG